MALLGRSRTQTRRPRRDEPLPRVTVFRGAVLLVLFGGIMWLAASLYNGVPTTHYRKVFVSIPTIGNLLSHDAVRVGGKRIGQVARVDLGNDGHPRVQLQLNPGTEVPKDTKIVVRANGLLGARYVQLTPGTSHTMLPDGGTLTAGPQSFSNGLPEAIDTFDAPTREGFQTTIDEVSTGLIGLGGPLNGTIRQLAIGPRQFGEVARGVLSRKGAAGRLIPSLDSAMNALEPNRAYNRPFLVDGARAATPFVTEHDATRATIAKAPSTLDAARAGLDHGQKLLTSVRDFAQAASMTLPQAPAALRDTSALLGAAPGTLRRLYPALDHQLPTAADGARQLLVDVDDKLVPRLKNTIDLARTPLDWVGDHACDVTNFGAVMRSMTGFGQTGFGVNGPAMAFRLEAVAPAGLEAVGIKDSTGLLKRVGHEAPCTYDSKPYPQLSSDPLGTNTPGQGLNLPGGTR